MSASVIGLLKLAVFFLATPIFLFSLSALGFAQKQAPSLIAQKVADAKSSQYLESLLLANPDSAAMIVPRLEKLLIAEIQSKGYGERFVLEGVKPSDSISCAVTVESLLGFSHVSSVKKEYEDDCTALTSLDAQIGLPMGNGSIHRFSGSNHLEFVPGYEFNGDRTPHQRLTFALIEGIGYIYLRGKGCVINQEKKLLRCFKASDKSP